MTHVVFSFGWTISQNMTASKCTMVTKLLNLDSNLLCNLIGYAIAYNHGYFAVLSWAINLDIAVNNGL
ncbi:Uncharacterised protein [Vibrio cholerae]|nr:Uncharacterised protein [Vibrio cholerae]